MNENQQNNQNQNNKPNDLDNKIQIIEEKITKLTGENQTRTYYKKRMLGKGGFAKCYEFECASNQKIFAAKVISKTSLIKDRAKQKLISEIKIHKSTHHQNIVAFEHYFEDYENVYILLEICQNQTLKDLLQRRKRLTEIEVQCYMIQLIKCLKYLHAHRIIHRDLKLGNLFLNDKLELKVGDFGLATKLDYAGERKRSICGTPNYIAPEIIDGKSGHSYEVDIWSMGVIIYTLLIGKPPFETNDIKSTYRKIKTCNYTFPEGCVISPAAKLLICEILVLNPAKRLTLDQMLTHEFFNLGISIPKLLPLSTLACPPNIEYIQQFMPDAQENGIVNRMKPKNNLIEMLSNTKDETQNSSDNNNNSQINKVEEHIHSNIPIKPPEIFVQRWVDYSSKYGLAYLLSNGNTGVYFNDNTKIILNIKTSTFDYIDKKAEEENSIQTYPFQYSQFPKELDKKVALLHHFKNYLEGDHSFPIMKSNDCSSKENVYIRRWMRTKHAIIFRLSHKVIQVCFLDKTEIFLNVRDKTVSYSNKQGEKFSYTLNQVLHSNNYEITKRFKYTQDVLAHMINMNQYKKMLSENMTLNQEESKVEV